MKVISKISIFLGFLLLIIGCKPTKKIDKTITLPFFNSAELTPEWISEDDTPAYKNVHTIPKFSFVNQDGKEVTNKTYENKIYVADFFFVTCPGICPILRSNMSKLQEKYKNDKGVFLLSHTVMPVKDSVTVLRKYAAEHDIVSNKWNLVTGNKKEIYNIARKGYFADEDFAKTQDEDAFIHTENFVLVDKKGRIRGVYNGTLNLDVQRLVRHIEILKKEI